MAGTDFLRQLPPGSEVVQPDDYNKVVQVLNGDSGPGAKVGASFFASNPVPIAGLPLDWGGEFFHVSSPSNPSGRAIGMKGGQTVDDTASINAAIAAAIAVSSGDDAFGATALMGPDTYRTTALTYNGGRWALKGAGIRSTCIRQISGATFAIAPTGSGFPYADVLFEDFDIELWLNGSSLGGIDMRGSMRSTARRVFVDGAPAGADGIRIAGQGTAASGDAMFCTVEECEFNPQNAVSICIHLVSAAGGGSHPDAARVINNFANCNASTTFLKADAVAAVGGYLGIGNLTVAFNRVEGAGTLYDVAGQGFEFFGGWAEVTSGTMAVTIQAGPANYPTQNTTFWGGVFSTYGDPTKFLITDNGANTRWYAGQVGTSLSSAAATATGTITLDPSKSDEWVLTLTGSFTVVIPNSRKGMEQRYKLIHDGTGTAFVGTWPAGTKFAGGAFGTTKAGTNTAGSIDYLTLRHDGTNWNEVARALNLS